MHTWELVARERVRDTLARYHWAGDAGRIEELAQTFCEDGELDIRGLATLSGRQEISSFLTGVAAPAADSPPARRRIVRHNLTNTLFTEVAPERISVSSYFTVVTEIGLDHYGRYRDVFVPVGQSWLIRSRRVSTDWSAENSTMASVES